MNGNENMINSFLIEVEKIYHLYFSNNLKVYLILEYIVNNNIHSKKLTDPLRSKIFDSLKFINSDNLEIVQNEKDIRYELLADNILKDSENYYTSYAQKYKNKIDQIEQITYDKINYTQEDLVKLYIKLGIISKIFNISLIEYNCFEKAYGILTNNIQKNRYLFSIEDERYIFIEKKYIADWLLYNILYSISLKDPKINFSIDHYLSIHLKHFNIEKFIENKNLISSQLKLFNLYWKFFVNFSISLILLLNISKYFSFSLFNSVVNIEFFSSSNSHSFINSSTSLSTYSEFCNI
jgi:hypothetical protein